MTAPRTTPAAGTTDADLSRWRRLLAFAVDVTYGVLASLLAGGAAGAWLFARTAWGRDDVPAGDATFAAALLLAATPAWLAWTAARVARVGATPGQGRCGLGVAGTRPRRLLRLALHPLATPGWLWLAVLAAVARFERPALGLAAGAGVVFLGGLVTAGRAALDPRGRGLHDLVAGTRLNAVDAP